MHLATRIFSLILISLFVLTIVLSQANSNDNTRSTPRFVSLKKFEVNLRTGPGERYPIDWVFQRKNLPVEITAEFDIWRRIRDSEGTVGWIHQSLLSSHRTAIVSEPIVSFKRKPTADSPIVFKAEKGVILDVIKCNQTWCQLKYNKDKAWVQKHSIWGIYSAELVN